MTYIELLIAISWLSPITLFIGTALGLISFKSLNIVTKGITVYLAIMLLVDIVMRLLPYFQTNNHIVLPIYCLIELGLFTYFYNKYFLSRRYLALNVITILALVYIVWDIITFSFTSAKDFQSYAKVFDNFGIILLALTYCYEKLDQPNVAKWKNFRLNIVVLIFFTINLILFLPYNFIINDNGGIQFYFMQGILFTTVFFYIYLSYFIWQNSKKATPVTNKA